VTVTFSNQTQRSIEIVSVVDDCGRKKVVSTKTSFRSKTTYSGGCSVM
jgi:hypothetical protein